jgi:CRP-like cAMP-binding protein
MPAMNASELRGIRVLAKLTDAQLERLLAYGAWVEFTAHQMIITQGQKADAIYFLTAGSVGSYATDAGGGQSPLRNSEPGSHFGEVGVIQNGIRTASVRATTQCRVFRISAESFKAILNEPELATPLLYAFAKSMALRIADITHRLAEAQSLKDAWVV